jgi:hypothetical protein
MSVSVRAFSALVTFHSPFRWSFMTSRVVTADDHAVV